MFQAKSLFLKCEEFLLEESFWFWTVYQIKK